MSAGEDTPEFPRYLSEEECGNQLNSSNAERTVMTDDYHGEQVEGTACSVLACETCGACFASPEFLIRHQRYGHTGKAYQQSAAGRKRPAEENVKEEVPVSKGSTGRRRSSRPKASLERSCDLCGRHFTNSSHLSRHRRTHTRNSDEFVCPDCWLSFNRKDALQRHVVTHTGERPYVCRVCGYGFTQRSSATRHERNIHGL